LKTDFSEKGGSAYAFSPDGKTVAISGKEGDKHLIAVYDVTSAKRVKTLEGCTGAITSLSFTPDANTLAAPSIDETRYVQPIHLWDVAPATKSEKGLFGGGGQFGGTATGGSDASSVQLRRSGVCSNCGDGRGQEGRRQEA